MRLFPPPMWPIWKRRESPLSIEADGWNAVTAWLEADQLQRVLTLPYVRTTRPVARLGIHVMPAVPRSPVIAPRYSANCTDPGDYGPSCNQLDVANAIPPLQRGINGQGVLLGFLDTQFASGSNEPFTHAALNHLRTSGQFQEWRDFTNRDAAQACNQSSTHGQAVASVAVGYDPGEIIGPAHGATVYAATTECAPYERNIEEDNFVAAVEWLEAEGVDIMTTSLGYSSFDSGQQSYTTSDMDGDTGITTNVFDFATQRGVVTVSSAGNAGNSSWRIITTPADGDSVIAVGAVSPSGNLVGFSSRGPTADGRFKPDVSAQGSNVRVASGAFSYAHGSGTSFSAPMVAAVVAQVLQANPNLEPRQVWAILTETASQASNPDNNLGWGIVNADAAVTRATPVAIEPFPPSVPASLVVHSPFPNPFRTKLNLMVDARTPVAGARVSVYNVLGQEIATSYAGALPSGRTTVQIDGTDFAPGVYMYVLAAQGQRQTGAIVRVR